MINTEEHKMDGHFKHVCHYFFPLRKRKMAPREVERSFGSIADDEGSENNSIVTEKKKPSDDAESLSNEYVLNVAFLSFVGFLLIQAVFALIANSQAMLADSEAMSVDALTYLFNLMAERIKTRPFSASELELPSKQRTYRRELQRLYLELIPPALSIMTLIAVTIMTLNEAFSTLFGSSPSDEEDDVSVPIMLSFSGANLLLDIVNVTCFAQANSIYGLDIIKPSQRKQTVEMGYPEESVNESSSLLHSDKRVVYDENDDIELVNLNMCSAWTVSTSCLSSL
jgi:Co/Zn/Cd efflux system component